MSWFDDAINSVSNWVNGSSNTTVSPASDPVLAAYVTNQTTPADAGVNAPVNGIWSTLSGYTQNLWNDFTSTMNNGTGPKSQSASKPAQGSTGSVSGFSGTTWLIIGVAVVAVIILFRKKLRI